MMQTKYIWGANAALVVPRKRGGTREGGQQYRSRCKRTRWKEEGLRKRRADSITLRAEQREPSGVGGEESCVLLLLSLFLSRLSAAWGASLAISAWEFQTRSRGLAEEKNRPVQGHLATG